LSLLALKVKDGAVTGGMVHNLFFEECAAFGSLDEAFFKIDWMMDALEWPAGRYRAPQLCGQREIPKGMGTGMSGLDGRQVWACFSMLEAAAMNQGKRLLRLLY